MKKLLSVAALAAMTLSVSHAVDTKACAGCHGANFEKKAMNISKVVKDMSKDDIVKALKGYKDGSYGGAMKGVMAGQVANLSDADIDAIATQIAGGEEKAADATNAAEAAKGAVEGAADAAKTQATEMAKQAVDNAVDKAVDTATEKATEAATKAASHMMK